MGPNSILTPACAISATAPAATRRNPAVISPQTALTATGDRFGIYGFSSLRRQCIRFHLLKDFNQRYDGLARGRILAIKPGFYTRMGAAIRQAAGILAEQAAGP